MAQVISRKNRGGMGKFESVSTRRPIFSLSLGYSLVSFRPDNRVGRDTSGEAETCVLFREYAEFCARSN